MGATAVPEEMDVARVNPCRFSQSQPLFKPISFPKQPNTPAEPCAVHLLTPDDHFLSISIHIRLQRKVQTKKIIPAPLW